MSKYQEGQKVQTPDGAGKVAADQIDEQVYVLLTDTGSMETFHEGEISADTTPEDAGPKLTGGDSFDFDNFLEEENKPKDDY